jgi:hypothetical protein
MKPLNQLRVLCSSVTLLGLIIMGSSQTETMLSFEEFTGMANSPGAVIPVNARLSDQYLAVHGLVFASTSPYVAVVNIGAGHAADGRNALGGSTVSGALSYAPVNPINGHFFQPGNRDIPYVTDFISVTGDRFPAFGTMRLQAYNVNGQLIQEVTAIDAGLTEIRITTPTPAIHRFSFIGTGNVAIDKVRFHTAVGAVSGDVNGDGCVDDADLLAVLFAFGSTGSCMSEDLNNDGVVDDADLLEVLFNFGSGC